VHFQEYSEELKSIGRVSKSSKLMTDENGVTITAIKHNNDQMSETSGLKYASTFLFNARISKPKKNRIIREYP
jgi:hypothetical protein